MRDSNSAGLVAGQAQLARLGKWTWWWRCNVQALPPLASHPSESSLPLLHFLFTTGIGNLAWTSESIISHTRGMRRRLCSHVTTLRQLHVFELKSFCGLDPQILAELLVRYPSLHEICCRRDCPHPTTSPLDMLPRNALPNLNALEARSYTIRYMVCGAAPRPNKLTATISTLRTSCLQLGRETHEPSCRTAQRLGGIKHLWIALQGGSGFCSTTSISLSIHCQRGTAFHLLRMIIHPQLEETGAK